MRRTDAGTLFTGLVLIAVGAIFLAEQLNLADFGSVLRTWWPMILILLGVSKLTSWRSAWSGLWLVAIGAWLQLVQLSLFDLTYRNSWPLILIALGGVITVRALFEAVAGRGTEGRHES